MEAAVFIPDHLFYNFPDVEVRAVSYRYRSQWPIILPAKVNALFSSSCSDTAGIRLTLEYSDSRASCSSDGIPMKNTPLSISDCVMLLFRPFLQELIGSSQPELRNTDS